MRTRTETQLVYTCFLIATLKNSGRAFGIDRDHHFATRPVVANGIAHQIGHDLLHQRLVAIDENALPVLPLHTQ